VLSCKKTALRLAMSIDEALPWHQAILLRLHLMICKTCAGLKEEFTALSEAAKYYASQEEGSGPPLTSVRLSPEMAEAIKKRIRSEGSDNSL